MAATELSTGVHPIAIKLLDHTMKLASVVIPFERVLPNWNGREIYLVYAGAAVSLTLAYKFVLHPYLLSSQVTESEEPLVSFGDYTFMKQTCYETSCGLLPYLWGSCISKKDCYAI